MSNCFLLLFGCEPEGIGVNTRRVEVTGGLTIPAIIGGEKVTENSEPGMDESLQRVLSTVQARSHATSCWVPHPNWIGVA